MKTKKQQILFTRIDNPIARKLVEQFSEQYADDADSIVIDRKKLMAGLAKELNGGPIETPLGLLDVETYVRKSYEQMPEYDQGYFDIDGLGQFGKKHLYGIFKQSYEAFMQGAVRTPGEERLHYEGYARCARPPVAVYKNHIGHSVIEAVPSKRSIALLFE